MRPPMTRWRSNALDVADVDEKRNVVARHGSASTRHRGVRSNLT